jgi:hypothetical protein
MSDDIKVIWMPKARAMELFFRPLLQRSYQKWRANGRRDVTSEYAGGQLLTVTTVTTDGQVTQIALCRDEVDDVPEPARTQMKKDLAQGPTDRGFFSAQL